MVRVHPGLLKTNSEFGKGNSDWRGQRTPTSPFRIPNLKSPRGAAWSARLSVTQEIVGSNPIGGA